MFHYFIANQIAFLLNTQLLPDRDRAGRAIFFQAHSHMVFQEHENVVSGLYEIADQQIYSINAVIMFQYRSLSLIIAPTLFS